MQKTVQAKILPSSLNRMYTGKYYLAGLDRNLPLHFGKPVCYPRELSIMPEQLVRDQWD